MSHDLEVWRCELSHDTRLIIAESAEKAKEQCYSIFQIYPCAIMNLGRAWGLDSG